MKNAFGPAAAFAVFAVLSAPTMADARAKHSISLPSPRLVFQGSEPYEANGFDFVRYQYDVTNKAKYPKALFQTSQNAPPCGQNVSATRIAVAIYDTKGKQLVEFCSLPGPERLDGLWFAVAKDTVPPAGVYIEITDRLTGKKARSQVAPTSKP
ncbi:MAG: hypothetical protein ABIW03_01405 [Sphingomicrobium sp.]